MPNLSYCSEKLRYSITLMHSAYREIRALRAAVPAPWAEESKDPRVPTCAICEAYLHQAFRNLIVGYCEIHGMMELLDGSGVEDALLERLLAFSYTDLKEWLDRFDHNGELSADGWRA